MTSRYGHGATSGCPRRFALWRSHPVLSVDAADGVRAGRILFSLREPLGAIDRFERAIVECDDPSAVETGRLSCLVILDRLAATGQPRASR